MIDEALVALQLFFDFLFQFVFCDSNTHGNPSFYEINGHNTYKVILLFLEPCVNLKTVQFRARLTGKTLLCLYHEKLRRASEDESSGVFCMKGWFYANSYLRSRQ